MVTSGFSFNCRTVVIWEYEYLWVFMYHCTPHSELLIFQIFCLGTYVQINNFYYTFISYILFIPLCLNYRLQSQNRMNVEWISTILFRVYSINIEWNTMLIPEQIWWFKIEKRRKGKTFSCGANFNERWIINIHFQHEVVASNVFSTGYGVDEYLHSICGWCTVASIIAMHARLRDEQECSKEPQTQTNACMVCAAVWSS